MKSTWMGLVISSVLMSGCLLGNKKIVLDYGPNYQVATSSGTSGPLVFEDFADKRTAPRVGERKNGYYMTMSKIFAENDVAKWVNDAIDNELKKNGFNVIRTTDSIQASGNPVLSGAILDVNSISYMAYTGIIKLKAILSNGTQEIGETLIETNTKPGVNFSASTKGHSKALHMALEEAVAKVVGFVKLKLKESTSVKDK